MSVKIYDGHRVPVAQFAQRLPSLDAAVREAFWPDLIAMVADRITLARIAFEESVVSGREPHEDLTEMEAGRLREGSPGWRSAVGFLRSRARELSVDGGPRDPFEDLNLAVRAWFCGDGEHLLLLPQCEFEGPLQAAMAHLGATDYGYWDNSERAEGISAGQWEVRRRDWEVLTENDNAKVSWTFDVQRWLSEVEMSAFFPEMSERLVAGVREQISAEHAVVLGLSGPDEIADFVDSPLRADLPAGRSEVVAARLSQLAALDELTKPEVLMSREDINWNMLHKVSAARREIYRGQDWKHIFEETS